MDKITNYKKSLVRNTEQNLRKCKITTVVDTSSKSKKELHQKTKNEEIKVTKASSKSSHFDTPELYSTLKIDKTIGAIIQPRKTKSSLDQNQKKLSVDEKVSH